MTGQRTPRQQRNGRPRQRAIAHVRATQPVCWLCGHPIDLTRNRQTDPLGSTVDEIHPLSLGGDPLDPDNLRHAHRQCNSARGNRPVTPELQARLAARIAGHSGTPSRRWLT